VAGSAPRPLPAKPAPHLHPVTSEGPSGRPPRPRPALLATFPVGAALIGVSSDTLRRWYARGVLPPDVVVRFPNGLTRLRTKRLLAWAAGEANG
jgi:hypothetical protein